MTISDMHILFRLSLDKVGNTSLPFLEPAVIDIILNYAIKTVVKQRITGNNSLRQGAEETTIRRQDLQNLITESIVPSSAFVIGTKPYGSKVLFPSDMFFLLDEEVCISSKTCNTSILSDSIEEGEMYKVTNGTVTYNSIAYTVNNVFMGVNGITTATYSTGAIVHPARRINVLPIRNDQYNSLILDPFNRPDINKILRLDYGATFTVNIITGPYVELISSKGISIDKYYVRYYRTPRTVIFNTIDCDLPSTVHQDVVDYAVNWTLENIESPRFQTQIANLSRND